MSNAQRSFHVAVVGATGAVGETMLSILAERGFPVGRLSLLASERSAGGEVEYGGDRITVQDLASFDPSGVDIALFSAGGSVSKEYGPKFAAAGAVVIDNSSAFRYDDDVPLVVSEVNPEQVANRPRGIIANPNCSTMQMLVAQLLSFQEIDPQRFPVQIAFNLIPHIDDFLDNGFTKEEMKLVWETRKILGDDSILVNPTAVRVPVFYGHSEAVAIETREKVDAEAARELLSRSPGVEVVDTRQAGGYPTPVTHASGTDAVYVGRIREDLSHPRGLNLWIVSDNIRKGAALNAVQLAELVAAESR